jgi:hypothetical protein
MNEVQPHSRRFRTVRTGRTTSSEIQRAIVSDHDVCQHVPSFHSVEEDKQATLDSRESRHSWPARSPDPTLRSPRSGRPRARAPAWNRDSISAQMAVIMKARLGRHKRFGVRLSRSQFSRLPSTTQLIWPLASSRLRLAGRQTPIFTGHMLVSQ